MRKERKESFLWRLRWEDEEESVEISWYAVSLQIGSR